MLERPTHSVLPAAPGQPFQAQPSFRHLVAEVKLMFCFYLKITDKNYIRFLSDWRKDNKPHVLLFDHMPVVPLLYKVNVISLTSLLTCL